MQLSFSFRPVANNVLGVERKKVGLLQNSTLPEFVPLGVLTITFINT
jgi:hypothetical protein